MISNISSFESPRVSGTATAQKIAFNKHIIPKVIMQAEMPMFSKISGKIYPMTNKMNHTIEMSIASDISRIWNLESNVNKNHDVHTKHI